MAHTGSPDIAGSLCVTDCPATAIALNARRSPFLRLQQRRQNLTRSANLHLFAPIPLNRAFTNGAVNKPAEPSSLKLPGRTSFLFVRGTALYNPAGLSAFLAAPHPGDEEKNLPLHMGRHLSPSLFVAMDSL